MLLEVGQQLRHRSAAGLLEFLRQLAADARTPLGPAMLDQLTEQLNNAMGRFVEHGGARFRSDALQAGLPAFLVGQKPS